MKKKQLKEALDWQIEMGVSETFSKKIIKEKKLKEKKSVNIAAESGLKNKNTLIPEKQNNKNNDKFLSDAFPENIQEWLKLARKLADEAKTLDELKIAVTNFDGLAIKKTATNCVFSDGNPNSELMLIGEAPGENEDEQGIPFCGVSGRLLDNMLSYIGHTRANNYYITNTIFWRPPGNRKPTPEEIALCRPFVEKHIALINPKAVILVGATATFSVLQKEESISSLKKTIHNYNSSYLGKDVPCFAIYHPSYLLRQPTQKKNTWHDLLKIKKFIENA